MSKIRKITIILCARAHQVGFSDPDAAQEDDIGLIGDDLQAEEVFDLQAVDFFRPAPVELIKCFNHREASLLDAALGAAIAAVGGLPVGEFFEVIDVGELFFGRLRGKALVVLADKGQLR